MSDDAMVALERARAIAAGLGATMGSEAAAVNTANTASGASTAATGKRGRSDSDPDPNSRSAPPPPPQQQQQQQQQHPSSGAGDPYDMERRLLAAQAAVRASANGVPPVQPSLVSAGAYVQGSVLSGPSGTISMTIPNNIVGYVIGRGGENLKNIQATTGCNCQIAKEFDMPPGSNERSVTITGGEEAMRGMAKAMLDKLVSERTTQLNGGSSGLPQGGSSSSNGGSQPGSIGGLSSSNESKVRAAIESGHSFLKVRVPDADVGLIIGKGGCTIRSIQERTGANIQIPQQPDKDDAMHRTVVITHPNGPGCEQTKALMEEVLLTKTANGANSSAIANGSVTQTIPIPDGTVGMVIGKGGSIIKELQRQSKSRLQIPTQPDADNQTIRTCTMTGPVEGLDYMRSIIERIILENSTNFFTQDPNFQSSNLGGAAATQQQNVYGAAMGAMGGVMYGQQPAVYGAYGAQQTAYDPYAQQYAQQAGYGMQQQPQQYGAVQATAQPQQDYSKEWAAYYAAQAAAASGGQPAAAAVAATPAAAQAAAVVAAATAATPAPAPAAPADPTAYYDQFWQYVGYYGEEKAREFYGAWSPPVGTPNPNASGGAANGAAAAAAAATSAPAPAPALSQSAIQEAAKSAKDSSVRNVSNLPAWMTKSQ